MNVRGAALAAVLGVAACGGPGPAPTPGVPHVPGETATTSRRSRVVPRVEDSTCIAAGHDGDTSIETMVDGDLCSGAPAPVFFITGRLVDADGAPAPDTRLRFWCRESMKNTDTDWKGRFELETDVDDVSYDVDAILSERDSTGRGALRRHVGRLKPGDHDVVLRIDVAPEVLVAGTLLDDAGRPLAGWKVSADAAADGRAPAEVAMVETDAAGRFRITSWKKQPVTLRAQSPHLVTRTILRQDIDAGTGETRVAIAPPGIAGHVIVENGATPQGAIVRLRGVSNGTMRSAVVDATGVFSFDRLDADAVYELSAELSGYTSVPDGGCSGESPNVELFLVAPEQILEGRAFDTNGAPLATTWVRFVADDETSSTQAMTERDGTFRASDARGVDYVAFALAPGDDGRLVPGPKLGHCRGGDRNLELRAAR